MTGIFDKLFTIERPIQFTERGKPVKGLTLIGEGVCGRLTTLSRSQFSSVGSDNQRLTHRFSLHSAVDIRQGDIVTGNSQKVRVDAVGLTSTGRRKECICESIGDLT